MRTLLLLLVLSFLSCATLYSQEYQLPNGGFEKWDGSGEDATPTNWNGFPSAQCDLGGGIFSGCGIAKSRRHEKSNDIRPGSTGNHSCKIFATSVIGIIANGVITTGQIRIGSKTATDPANYNITRTGNPKFYQVLTATPDSISFWAKFICPNESQNARMNAFIHDNYDMCDPLSSDAGAINHLVASATKEFNRGDQGWNFYSMPFNYDAGSSNDPRYILITFTTNKLAGKGSDKDVLYIDDIEFVYNNRLKLLSVNGEEVDHFSAEKLEYYVYVPSGTEPLVSATAQSPRAKVDISHSYETSKSIVKVSAGGETREYKINYIFVSEFKDQICQGSTYSLNGFDIPIQNITGVFNFEITEKDDSDNVTSLKKLVLEVNPTYTEEFLGNVVVQEVQIPEGETYNFHGDILTETGLYEKTLQSVKSCDSIAKLNLTVSTSYLINISASICAGNVYTENGFNESTPGEYKQHLKSKVNGCDSIVVLTLVVNESYGVENPIMISDTLTAGNRYERFGFSYPKNKFDNTEEIVNFNDTVYSKVFLTGCDSVTVLNLTVFPIPKIENEEEPEEEESEEKDISEKVFTLHYNMNEHNVIIIKSDNKLVSTEKYTYYVFDSYGKKVLSDHIRSDRTELHLDKLNPGIYILNVFTKPTPQRLKFVVF